MEHDDSPGWENLAFLEEMYDKWEAAEKSGDLPMKHWFSTLGKKEVPEAGSNLSIYRLIEAYRRFGHLAATLSTLKPKKKEDAEYLLDFNSFGFSSSDLEKQYPTMNVLDKPEATLREILEHLQTVYSKETAFEYYGDDPELEAWIKAFIERKSHDTCLTSQQKRAILHALNRSELFEVFLHTKYVGQKRFSLEGGETLIPMLEILVEESGLRGVEEIVFGMAHRGRLNVLCNILQKTHLEMFSEFEDISPTVFEGSGDVKYHKGYVSKITTPQGKKMNLFLSPNPSHLESVSPVVEGIAYARQQLSPKGIEGVLPVLIHGDAALAGQGVVYETLQMSSIPGYSAGGTIHFVINNEVGFTTNPEEGRSTRYCTAIARAFSCPVIHVNAEDPEKCVEAVLEALDIREKFHKDVFIDLYCYRKYGHNESDEPAFTQPIEYQSIRNKKPIRELYRDQVVREGSLDPEVIEKEEETFKEGLKKALEEAKGQFSQGSNNNKNSHEAGDPITAVLSSELRHLLKETSTFPQAFTPHPKLKALFELRQEALEKSTPSIDWALAEWLAFASILVDGIDVRLSGQDSGRGTFSQRHAQLSDQNTGERYVPLQHLEKGGRFEIYNSPLSEFGVLGFEFGFSLGHPSALVLWEAQFGDFANSAQVIIDQYIASSSQKWGQNSRLTLLLPHGYEGQGPEHSSARIERFLTLAAEGNMVVAYPSTPAQYFHLLRRQAKTERPRPLIIFTPKALLRHPLCTSSLTDFEKKYFLPLIPDDRMAGSEDLAIFCTGKVYFDLLQEREKRNDSGALLFRVEELYPFPESSVKDVLEPLKNLKYARWVQEEPKNMGARNFVHEKFSSLMPAGVVWNTVSRPEGASPAVGSHKRHKKELDELLEGAFRRE